MGQAVAFLDAAGRRESARARSAMRETAIAVAFGMGGSEGLATMETALAAGSSHK